VSDPQLAKTDVVLVGAGIMSATLASLLQHVQPDWSITLVERLDAAAAESSDPWNNAGTGHSGYCELNYTPSNADGSVDIGRAVRVNEQFQITRQFWAAAVENGRLGDPRSFCHPVPHAGFVHGAPQVDFLRRRHEALIGNPLFATMEFVTDRDEFSRRLPLMADNRDFGEPIALSWAPGGTDVDFGALSRQLIGHAAQRGMATLFGREVRGLRQQSDGNWTLSIVNRRTGQRRRLNAKFVFVGAGGGAVPLLQKSGIREAKGLGGFPVGGAFLRAERADLTAAHHAKVYTMPAAGAPPLAGSHLDVRVINGKSWLLFGPFAGWSPKFLKHGRMTDLPSSTRRDNVASMVKVGLTNGALVRYLLGQLRQSESDRVRALREFVPSAVDSDWELYSAGQRVNVIRRIDGSGGVLEFGTTVMASADGSIAGLLGASPGASTAVPVMLDVMKHCFSDRYPSWLPMLKDMVPSLGVELANEPKLFDEVWSWTSRVLKLDESAEAAVATP
jgi:malate dehydrogenase (quinone)